MYFFFYIGMKNLLKIDIKIIPVIRCIIRPQYCLFVYWMCNLKHLYHRHTMR